MCDEWMVDYLKTLYQGINKWHHRTQRSN